MNLFVVFGRVFKSNVDKYDEEIAKYRDEIIDVSE